VARVWYHRDHCHVLSWLCCRVCMVKAYSSVVLWKCVVNSTQELSNGSVMQRGRTTSCMELYRKCWTIIVGMIIELLPVLEHWLLRQIAIQRLSSRILSHLSLSWRTTLVVWQNYSDSQPRSPSLGTVGDPDSLSKKSDRKPKNLSGINEKRKTSQHTYYLIFWFLFNTGVQT